jgi:hypothetical protein
MTTSIPTFSDPVSIALIGMIGTFLTALLGLFTAYLGRQNSKSIVATQASVEAQHGTISALEKNTNSIKDALVKVTGEREFARGLKLGSDAATGDPAGVAALAADVQIKAARAEGIATGTATEKNHAAAEKAAQEPKKEV